ncbi:MAG TPA: endonuclease/exonuclease/phosphatase family protein [Devosia sp.]|jgi:endonuclease/exonuclease/phosphatase family metal-dependent hydrolase|nr:endonuclease/exonuclease/phosphatase family protein [Devosia sp.]
MMRVCSYNIRRGLGTDRRRKPARNLDVIAEVSPAVIAIQEAQGNLAGLCADYGWGEGGAYSALRLEEAEDGVSWRGNMLLVREDVTVFQTTCVALPSVNEPRGAIIADLGHSGRQFRLVGMHFGLRGAWRHRQTEFIIDHTDALEKQMALVMLGDLNEWNTRTGCLHRFAARHNVVAPGPSFHARLPMLPLDRIITSGEVRVEKAGVHVSPQARLASDHLPVWADLTLPA